MGPIETGAEFILGIIRDLGVDCSADPQTLNLPGVWITPSGLSQKTLAGTSGIVTFHVYLITPNHGWAADVATLDDLAAKLAGPLGIADWTAETINLANQAPDPLPCLHGQTSTEWSNNNVD